MKFLVASVPTEGQNAGLFCSQRNEMTPFQFRGVWGRLFILVYCCKHERQSHSNILLLLWVCVCCLLYKSNILMVRWLIVDSIKLPTIFFFFVVGCVCSIPRRIVTQGAHSCRLRAPLHNSQKSTGFVCWCICVLGAEEMMIMMKLIK